MFKVMLVDDEALILNGLKLLIDWEEIGLEIEHVANNGEEALEFFKKAPADIVITDITMPRLDGLNLIKEIKRISSRTRFIILSGYDDFNYAKLAISLGIENYILKPINEEELKATLVNTIAKLRNVNEQPMIEGKKLEMLKENILCRWVQNSISSYELEERNAILNINLSLEYYSVGIIKLDINRNEQLLENHEIYNVFKEQIRQFEFGEAFHDIECNLVCICGCNEKEIIERDFVKFFGELETLIKNKYNIDAFITLGSIEKGFQKVYRSYKEALTLQDYLLVLGFNRILSINDNIKLEKVEGTGGIIDSSELYKILLTKDEEKVDQYIEDVLNKLCSCKRISPEYVQNAAVRMVLMFNELSKELGVSKDKEEVNIKELIFEICKIKTFEELKLFIKQKCHNLFNRLKLNLEDKSPIVMRIISYLKENYNQEVSLKTLGFKYNVNPSYLGQVFYKETGEQFSEYLNKIRNTEAKELLLNTNLKINDVAKRVGYTDNSYFYKKFKETYGVSPNTLRNTKSY